MSLNLGFGLLRALALRKKMPQPTPTPQTQPWLDWQPIATFPKDGETCLAANMNVKEGFFQGVYYNEDGRLQIQDTEISYIPEFFTHWTKIPLP